MANEIVNQDRYDPPQGWVDARESVLSDVRDERRRQLIKWGIRNGMDEGTMLKILVEEVGEVAKAMLEKKHEADTDELRNELIQVSAVAAAMAQSLDTGSF